MKNGSILKKYLPAAASLAAIFIIWFAAAEIVNIKHILPSPVDVLLKIFEMRGSLFINHFPSTMITFAFGWGISVLLGIFLAILMYISSYARAMLIPLMTVTQSIPIMCISPLFVLWMGYTIQARVIVVVLSTFFVIALNTYSGFRGADAGKRDLLLSCGASKKDIFFKMTFPSAVPGLFTALKLTLPWALIDAAVAEWLGATEGLGYFSKRMISKMDGAAVLAPIAVLSITAIILMAVLKAIDRQYITWRNEV